jgi:acyl-CoA hydrolase
MNVEDTTSVPDRSPIVLMEEIFPGDTNPYGTAFGGKILALMDRAAGLAAAKYAHRHFVTASMDSVRFIAPVKQGDVAEVSARVVYCSRRTLGIEVDVHAFDKTEWRRRHCGSGLVFMVALSARGELLSMPGFAPATDEERAAWDRAKAAVERIRRG